MNDPKAICEHYDCAFQGYFSETWKSPHPYSEGEELIFCPECRDVDSIRVACDEPDCWKEATCGTPTDNGYRHTCGKHKPED